VNNLKTYLKKYLDSIVYLYIHSQAGNRRECCDVVRVAENLNFTEVMFRACMKDEIVAYT
jgi:hypothetical protein